MAQLEDHLDTGLHKMLAARTEQTVYYYRRPKLSTDNSVFQQNQSRILYQNCYLMTKSNLRKNEEQQYCAHGPIKYRIGSNK